MALNRLQTRRAPVTRRKARMNTSNKYDNSSDAKYFAESEGYGEGRSTDLGESVTAQGQDPYAYGYQKSNDMKKTLLSSLQIEPADAAKAIILSEIIGPPKCKQAGLFSRYPKLKK